tara:strand:+ start:83 stop:526 length:444 start_codon:yes stop_codon:yes gene_type:complete
MELKNMNLTATQQEIVTICDDIKALLVSKNRKYGNSALEPVRIFSQSLPTEQICVRIDDKLSRIAKGAGLLATDEDVINDLIGYLVLLKIAQRVENEASWEDGPSPELVRAAHDDSFNKALGNYDPRSPGNHDPSIEGPDVPHRGRK